MESDVAPVVQPLHLVAHVLKEKFVFVKVHLQPPTQQAQQEFHAERGDQALDGKHKDW